MKITYNENPLCTTIELDEHEKMLLWHRVKIEQLMWLLVGAHCHLTQDPIELKRALKEVDPSYLYTQDESKSEVDERVDSFTEMYIEALMSPHCGDCTCVACTCDKCMAEDMFDINTIKGLGSHAASNMNGAFGETHDNGWVRTRNIHEAIEYLENYEPTADWKGWEKHAGRWKAEAQDAANWLKIYRDDHFAR